MDPNVREFLDSYFLEKLDKVIRPLVEGIVNERLDIEVKRITRSRQHIAPPSVIPLSSSPPSSSQGPSLLGGIPIKRTSPFFTFGNESYDHMLMPYLTNVINGTTDLHAVLQKIVCDLFFNLDARKNNNIYIPKDSYKCINMWMSGIWKSYPLESTLEKVIKRANDVLQHYIIGSDDKDENLFKQQVGKKKFDMLLEFTDKIDNIERYPDLRAKLIKDTEHTILTNQHIVHGALINGTTEV